MVVELEHTGTREEDPLYSGFQRWWIEVSLPPGSSVTWSDHASMPDPEAPNGGTYLEKINPGERKRLSFVFALPDVPEVVFRRQSGLAPLDLAVSGPTCSNVVKLTVQADVRLDLSQPCPGLRHEEPETASPVAG